MNLTRTTSTYTTLAAAVAITLTLSGCGSNAPKKKEYAAPQQLCGVAVTKDLVEPILPPGKKIEMKESGNVGSVECEVFIDGKPVMEARLEWFQGDQTVVGISRSEWKSIIEDTNADQTFGYSDRGGSILVKCPNPSLAHRKSMRFFGTIVLYDEMKRNKSDVKALVTAYGKEASKAEECGGRK
ncbi:hypothetical protein ACIQ9E_28370 [Streptomyces sp. NPDC094448]|uniref:hypothetical protein n=1 Tax=Streptomyces sp. NPDC094448 TaxID=3366063 RepID=UPI00380333D6